MIKAIIAHEPGGPEVMKVAEKALRAPGPQEVEIAVRAAGVNFIDIYQRTGLYKVEMPWVPGLEGAGEITAIGEGVASLKVGQHVAWASVAGSYAERVIAPAAKVVPVPDGLTFEQAAAAMLQGMTAQFLATTTYALKPETRAWCTPQRVGVGLLLCQLAQSCWGSWCGVDREKSRSGTSGGGRFGGALFDA
ncbi:MAG: alcohol dehydrogenase catalytic domain-containing protein [Polyangiaceae bacterium]